MQEPARLVCPQCALVYRLKKITPGRVHTCKNCGAILQNPDAPAGTKGAATTTTPAQTHATAQAQTQTQSQPDTLTSDFARLPKLIEKLTAQLDAQQEAQQAAQNETENDPAEDSLAAETAAKTVETLTRLESEVTDFAARLAALDDKITALPAEPTNTPEELSALKTALELGQTAVLQQMDTRLQTFGRELAALIPPAEEAGKTTVEVDIDELADRLVAGVKGRGPLYDAETESAVDVLARLADQLVKEQNSNTARLDKLAVEIHEAITNISKLEEWQTELPDRVADEIGATVEARVVGPISGALARQAPSILSELQDSKLVDIVSRSVREAQRPLLREILAGGRNGVPVWLFASVLLPLLLILGYLFLPGEIGGYGATEAAVPQELSDAIARIETAGVPLTPDAEDRLMGIEEAVLDIHNQALAHVKNAAALEEEVKSLRRSLQERDEIIGDYTTTLERQTKRLQAYEFRLVQLGVKPDAVAGQ